ncbi:universal stress protein [Baekduia soli]|nr:universal stress protein [Baekduia soli]
MSRPVLAAAHGDEAHDVVALATVLARIEDAPVLIAGIHVTTGDVQDYAAERETRAREREELDRLSADVPGDVAYDMVLHPAAGVPAGLEELAQQTGALAVVVGASHLGRFARGVRGDVGLGLLRDAPCPLLVAPRGYAAQTHGMPERIAVGWDETAEAEAAVAVAADLAHRVHGCVRLVHALAPPPVASELPYPDDPAFRAARIARAQERLDVVAAALSERVAVETEVVQDLATQALTQAGGRADLLVVGSRARGPVRRLLLGSVAEGLVHRAPCPLLVVPRGAAVPVA